MKQVDRDIFNLMLKKRWASVLVHAKMHEIPIANHQKRQNFHQ